MANINMGQAASGGGGGGVPIPWWQIPGTAGNSPAAALQNLTKSAPSGYTYDAVQMRYVPIVGSPADALSQRTNLQALLSSLFSGGGGAGSSGSTTSSIPNAAPIPAMSAPSGGTTTAARIPTVAVPDDSAAQAANFARSKDQVGQETAGSLTALRSALAGRGLLGGGMEVKGTANILGKGQGELGNTTRTNMTNEAARIDDFAKLGYQGAIEQRGQDITTNEGAANRALDVAKTNYSGGITQRGQDINQNVTQRGQDITARGQNLGPLTTLLSKLY
jgi:hypothetical protein